MLPGIFVFVIGDHKVFYLFGFCVCLSICRRVIL